MNRAPHRDPSRHRSALFALILMFALGAAGCESLRDGSGKAPRPVPALQRADALYAAGEYGAAAGLYQEILTDRPDHRAADLLLFRLGVIHLLPESPKRERDLGREYLDRLTAGYPGSPWAEPARLLLRLDKEVGRLATRTREQQQTIEELEERLETLKQIDLEHSKEPPLR